MKPTPGPWYYVYGAVWTTPGGPEDGGVCVATRASNAPIDPCEKDANMRLCAKAQQMREALEHIAQTAGHQYSTKAAIVRVAEKALEDCK